MRSEIIYRWKFGNFTNMWKLNNTVLSNQWDKEKLQKELKNILRLKIKSQYTKIYELPKNST